MTELDIWIQHPLTKGSEVWIAHGKSFATHYSPESKIRILHGTVTGGGDHLVIITWDHSGRASESRHTAARRLATTRESALERLWEQLRKDEVARRTEVETIVRLRHELIDLRMDSR